MVPTMVGEEEFQEKKNESQNSKSDEQKWKTRILTHLELVSSVNRRPDNVDTYG
jgi:hypothetical protein